MLFFPNNSQFPDFFQKSGNNNLLLYNFFKKKLAYF